MGRLVHEPLRMHVRKHARQIAHGVFVSTLDNISLEQYMVRQREYCSHAHQQPCHSCNCMVEVATIILHQSFCHLHEAFRLITPKAKYTAARAITKLLKMPLVVVRIGQAHSGVSFNIVLEKFPGTDYLKLAKLLNRMTETASVAKGSSIDRPFMKMLLNMTQSSRERECLRVAIVKASGISATKARRLYGLEKMDERIERVEQSIIEAQRIREAVEELAETRDKALMEAYGVRDATDSSENYSESDVETELQEEAIHSDSLTVIDKVILSDSLAMALSSLLAQSQFNWFEFHERSLKDVEGVTEPILSEFFGRIDQCGISDHDLQLVKQSHDAFLESENSEQQRIENALNGDIVTDSELDDPDSYVGLDLSSKEGQMVIAKKRAAIKRKARRLRAKLIAEKRFLCNKASKRVSKLLQQCPNIGEVIEAFVQERNVGADAWRRTGVLTFDGNVHLKEKVTYERIRRHLVDVYRRHISFGTVVELCVARNKRRRSAKRYRGLARVTTRRARKGFTLRYNPDQHWSSAFYKGLNQLQYKDGTSSLLINRDDASGFRLDTLTTCKQHASPVVAGHDVLTTRTDYVNKYPSVIQTTSYNFSATQTTQEVCVGVVKAGLLHHKNPAQHAADIQMLCAKEELSSVFIHDGLAKPIDFIRVDGATDEGPWHNEVQFWWTAWHMYQNKVATLVTTRSSGASYLNRVELQNGCLSLGHSNLFIPSTLHGPCFDKTTGKINEEAVKRNLSLAIDAYIHRVDKSPCADTVINLFKGPSSEEFQLKRSFLTRFLKTKKSHDVLQSENPDLYEYVSSVWQIRNDHMVTGLPTYVFYLLCCFKSGCKHPRCLLGKQPSTPDTWYPGGPPLSHLPLPKPDPTRPWGSTSCSTCTDVCSGHYCEPFFTDVTNKEALELVGSPPSVVLKKFYTNLQGTATEEVIESLAKKVLLPTREVGFWIEHLNTVAENRRRGAEKAAETRRRRKQTQSDERYFCGTCETEYKAEMPDIEFWILCDSCQKWYCCTCELLSSPPTSSEYVCLQCQSKNT